MRAVAVVVTLVAVSLSGCFGGSNDARDPNAEGVKPILPTGLEMEGAEVVEYTDTNLTWRFDGTLGPGVTAIVNGPTADVVLTPFQVPANIEFAITAELTWEDDAETDPYLAIHDEEGDLVCQSSYYEPILPNDPYEECTAMVDPLAGEHTWEARIEAYVNAGTSVPFTLSVTLTIPWWGDLAEPRPIVHTTDGQPLPAARWNDALPAFTSHVLPTAAFEPTLGVTPSGAAFYATVAEGFLPGVWRSEDRAANWTDVSPTIAGERTHLATNDPYVHVDPVTGRVFSDDMQMLACTQLSFSDEAGESWTTNPVACGSTPVDHQNLWTGPAPTGVTTVDYPRLVHLCYSDLQGGLWCTTSLDGGLSFRPASLLALEEEGNIYTNPTAPCDLVELGHGASGPDGTAYVPRVSCDTLLLHVSHDGGLTWEEIVVDDELGTIPDPNDKEEATVAVDAAGNVYYYWLAADRLPRLTVSTDEGQTWSEPAIVSAPDITATRFPSITAGDEGRIAFLYYGTTGPLDGRWDAYVGITLDALAAEPVIATVPANDPDDPLHVGRCVLRCGSMGDFMDIDHDPTTGEVWVALVDNCTPETCAPHGHPEADTGYHPGVAAVQKDGPGLLAGTNVDTLAESIPEVVS